MKSIRKVDLITIGRSSIDLYSQNIGSKFEDIKGNGFVDCVFSKVKEKHQKLLMEVVD